MSEDKQHTWEWRAGYDYATEKYKAEIAEWRQAAKVEASERRKAHAEIDRLRAENAVQDKRILE